MKTTGLDTWGSDIFLVKTSLDEKLLKALLLLDRSIIAPTRLKDKTTFASASLHHSKEKIRKSILQFWINFFTKTACVLFHIIEQETAKFTGVVYKKYRVDDPVVV